MRDLVNEEMAKAGTQHRCSSCGKQNDGKLTFVVMVDGEVHTFLDFGVVLYYAGGRVSRTKESGLDEVGVKLAEGGFIEMDAQSKHCNHKLLAVAIAICLIVCLNSH